MGNMLLLTAEEGGIVQYTRDCNKKGKTANMNDSSLMVITYD